MVTKIHNAILILAAASVCFAGETPPVTLTADPPLPAAKPGTLKGHISPAAKIQSLRAICRATGAEYEPAAFDAQTGRFTFADLPGGAAYDICIATKDSRQIEGIDLSFVDARLEQLAAARRARLHLPAPSRGTFTRNDVRTIRRFVAHWRDFMDTRRVLYIQGWGNRAVVLVELLRLREFYHARKTGSGLPDIVWRVELWYFTRQGDGWARIPNVERVLRRVRTTPSEWETISVEYDPRLTMTLDEAGRCTPLTYTIPDAPDPAKGRPAHTAPKLKTQPTISGVD